MYSELLHFDFKLEDLYKMTLKELIFTLDNKREGLAYNLWKQAYLIGLAFGKNFPKNPKSASPELYPKGATIPMPDVLLAKGGKHNVRK